MTNEIRLMPHTDDFEVIHYPAGELQVRLTPVGLRKCVNELSVTIKGRAVTPEQTTTLLLLIDAVRAETSEIIRVDLPYWPYGRADRRFTPGDCLGRESFLTLLRAAGASEGHTLDLHSIPNNTQPGRLVLHDHPATVFIGDAFTHFQQRYPKAIVLYPDDGALRRYPVNTNINYMACSKIRDPKTGVLSGFDVPDLQHPALIVDDICDGGGTFLGIAKTLADRRHSMPLGLYVTHGIFSKGLVKLLQAFEYIYCTNSFSDLDGSEQIVQYQVL